MSDKEEILSLDRNENLYGPATKCFEILKSADMQDLSFYSRDFTRGVKSALSERLAAEFGIPEQQILLSEGSEDMLKQAVHCYLGAGGKMLCPAQSWWYYQKVAEEVSGITVNYPLREDQNSFSYDPDEILRLCRQHSPRILLIASPNNPTGNSMQNAILVDIMKSAGDCVVIVDEAYSGFNGETNERVAPLIEEHQNLIILRTFSKYYALAGVRIGFAVVGKKLDRLAKFASRYLGYNRISEQLALAALDSPEYYTQIAENIRVDRQKYVDFFSQFNGFQCYRSDANFLLVRVPAELKSPLREYLRQNEVAIKFFPEAEFANHVRITVGTVNQNRRLLKLLDEFLQVWKDYGVPA